MSLTTEPKATATKRQEQISWVAKMALSSPADTISTSTWTADAGLTVVSNSNTDNTTTVVVSGGRVGAYCTLHNHIVTSASYEYDEIIILEITP